MNLRRTLTAVVLTAGLAAAAPLSASAARPGPLQPSDLAPAARPAAPKTVAAGTCDLSAPGRVAISRPYQQLAVRLVGPCSTGAGQGAWNLTHPTAGEVIGVGRVDGDEFAWDLFDEDPIGLQRFVPLGAFDAEGGELTQNEPVTTVKLAAGAWISSSRKADVVTLKGTSLLYSVGTNKFFKRSASGVFQFRERGSSTWQNLKSVTTNSAGEATLAYRYSPLRDYRFALYSTPISWDLGSAVTTR